MFFSPKRGNQRFLVIKQEYGYKSSDKKKELRTSGIVKDKMCSSSSDGNINISTLAIITWKVLKSKKLTSVYKILLGGNQTRWHCVFPKHDGPKGENACSQWEMSQHLRCSFLTRLWSTSCRPLRRQHPGGGWESITPLEMGWGIVLFLMAWPTFHSP